MTRLSVFVVALGLSGCVSTAVQLDCLAERASFEKPEARYGEFWFEAEYTKDGQLHEVSGTLACEYRGLNCTYAGLDIDWDRRVLAGDETIVLADLGDGVRVVKALGSCDYFMGTTASYVTYSKHMGATLHTQKDGSDTWSKIDPDDLLQEYGIDVVRWDYAEPISQERSE